MFARKLATFEVFKKYFNIMRDVGMMRTVIRISASVIS